MFRTLLKRLRSESRSSAPAINLFGESNEPGEQPDPIGLPSSVPHCSAWTTSRLERIFRRCSAQPDHPASLLEGRHARHCLSSFWLSAPVDQLERLYLGAVGQAYRELLHGPLPRLTLAPDEQAWKDALTSRLKQQLDVPERTNLLLAVMPYCRPGSIQLDNPLSLLPPWLLADYSRCFDPDLPRPADQPIGLLGQPNPSPFPAAPAPTPPAPVREPMGSVPMSAAPISAAPMSAAPMSGMPMSGTPMSGTPMSPMDAFASFPQLSPRRGTEAFAIFQDNEFCERMRGLINLFRLDPADRQVLEELIQLRRLIGQVWLDVTPASLESLYHSPMGKLYQDLLASNFGAVPCEDEDQEYKRTLTQAAINEAHPSMAQALLAAMLFHPQGKMRLGPGGSRLPLWLQQDFPTLAGLQTQR